MTTECAFAPDLVNEEWCATCRRPRADHAPQPTSCPICELTASLRAAEADAAISRAEAGRLRDERDETRRLYDGGLRRLRAAEERAAEAAKKTERVRERGLVAVQNVRTQRDAMERERDAAERRAEGLADALKKAHEAGLALLGWIAVCDMHGVVPNRNSVLAQNARAVLDPVVARPRSEETPTNPADRWVCPECDAGVKADEDGCCVHCGADCTVEPAPAATDKETP